MSGTEFFFFCNHNCSSLYQLPDRTEQVLTRTGGRVEVVASLSQGRTVAAHCGLFTHKSFPVIFEPPCICNNNGLLIIPISSTCFGRWLRPSSGALDCVYILLYNAPTMLPAGGRQHCGCIIQQAVHTV